MAAAKMAIKAQIGHAFTYEFMPPTLAFST
jgi:hypothetical protein